MRDRPTPRWHASRKELRSMSTILLPNEGIGSTTTGQCVMDWSRGGHLCGEGGECLQSQENLRKSQGLPLGKDTSGYGGRDGECGLHH